MIRKPVRYSLDMINEFRRLLQKHRSLQRQVERIGFASMMQLSKEEFEETKEIFTQIRLQSIAITDGLAFLLARFHGENVLVSAEYKILEAEMDLAEEEEESPPHRRAPGKTNRRKRR